MLNDICFGDLIDELDEKYLQYIGMTFRQMASDIESTSPYPSVHLCSKDRENLYFRVRKFDYSIGIGSYAWAEKSYEFFPFEQVTAERLYKWIIKNLPEDSMKHIDLFRFKASLEI